MLSDIEHYEQISGTLKQELEIFEQDRMKELKNNIHIYMKQACEQQEKVLEIWEAYLPIAKKHYAE